MQILLIRHGQSEADILNVHEGKADFPLTEEGREQARRMAARVLEQFPPDFIWASTLKRASETASILAEKVGCPVQYIPELQEHNNGELAGKPLEEVPFPWGILPHEKLGGDGESKIEFRARGEQIYSAIRHLSASYNRIAIVSHGGMITRIIESFLQLPVLHDIYFATGDTGIHLLEYNDLGRLIRFTNSTTHLDSMN
ncbi:histidine phosphatase family protein [Brevibacillus sp. 179-C9.3 HS]|uniref:histidine phosphatase family protein n=1 Tax=unclassified Brevibacillus TaxID=2684853 RepID=UPI0039A18FAA